MEGYEALYGASTWAFLFASVATTTFPVAYAFSNWRQRFVGRALMYQSICVALAVDFTTILHFFPHLGLTLVFAILNLLLPIALGICALALTFLMWELNHPKSKKRKSHAESDVRSS